MIKFILHVTNASLFAISAEGTKCFESRLKRVFIKRKFYWTNLFCTSQALAKTVHLFVVCAMNKLQRRTEWRRAVECLTLTSPNAMIVCLNSSDCDSQTVMNNQSLSRAWKTWDIAFKKEHPKQKIFCRQHGTRSRVLPNTWPTQRRLDISLSDEKIHQSQRPQRQLQRRWQRRKCRFDLREGHQRRLLSPNDAVNRSWSQAGE